MLEYYAGIQEAWDGPALLTFCDGKQIGALPHPYPTLPLQADRRAAPPQPAPSPYPYP